MKVAWKELTGDCWELIRNRVAIDDNYKALKAPSLVCKQFLSITDHLRHKLVAKGNVLYGQNCEDLFRILQRSRNLKEIEIRDPVFADEDDVNYPLGRIASSGLDLQALCLYNLRKPQLVAILKELGSAMKSLKILQCSKITTFQNPDLEAIADALPSLEELDIQYS